MTDRQPNSPNSDYRNPKIHSDLISLYTQYFGVHKNMSKYLRIAILESEILGSISSMMRLTIQINVMKSSAQVVSGRDVMAKIHELRSHVESIKSFSILLWQTKGITEGFFLGVMANIEEIGKQVAGWEKYLVKFLPKN
ncbi:MAG: hypothetical protein NTY08_09255 [Proteobacteria bacterium]|nr:hypothetical protein [Pseudomonadota bacterium]